MHWKDESHLAQVRKEIVVSYGLCRICGALLRPWANTCSVCGFEDDAEFNECMPGERGEPHGKINLFGGNEFEADLSEEDLLN